MLVPLTGLVETFRIERRSGRVKYLVEECTRRYVRRVNLVCRGGFVDGDRNGKLGGRLEFLAERLRAFVAKRGW